MIKLRDIQNSLTKLLSSCEEFEDYDIITEGQSEDVNCPTFFISIRPISTNSQMKYKEKVINVDITYVNKEDNHEENIDMVDELQTIFNFKLDVNGSLLEIGNLSFSEPSFLICSFTLRFYDHDEINKTEYEKMQELILRD